MKFFQTNKYHLGAVVLITAMFVLSVIIRKDNLSAPLSRHHEWITAHTLITCEIWSENGGPSAWHFSPVYTYPGKGNLRRTMLGGVVDEDGYVYYTSYPPFSFLFAYYATSVLGGPNTDSIRVVNLSIHFACTLLIYLLAILLAAPEKRKHLSVAGLLAAFLYLFSAGNLWIHGNLYFADTLVQLFVIVTLVLILLIFRKPEKREWLLLLGLFVALFLATYTEWLGLFLAFYTGIFFLILFFFQREKRFIKAFLMCALSSALALAVTLYQFSSIAGWDKYKEVSEKKYEERSGHKSGEDSTKKFNMENDEAYDFMIGRWDAQYKMAENFVGIAAIVLLAFLLIPNMRRKMSFFKPHVLVVALMLMAILTHYYLFFNFNSMHDFSALKTGFFMILVILVCFSLVEASLNVNLEIAFFVVCAVLAVSKGMESVTKFRDEIPLSDVNWNAVNTGKAIREHGLPDVAVFANIINNPELTYASHHNVFPVNDSTQIVNMMRFFENNKSQFYFHEEGKLTHIYEYELQNGNLVRTGEIPVSKN